MNDGRENRRSFRVSESVYLNYEIISDEEHGNGLDHRKTRLGESDSTQSLLTDVDARLGEAMFRLGAESELLGRCMTLLNDKINIVADALPSVRKAKAALAETLPLTCDVSADGMVFPSKTPIEINTKLHVQMLLASGNRFVESFGRVVRHTDVPAGNDTVAYLHGIAIEFQGMKPEQREMLIQHMFNRESETLRMRRLQLENEDI